MIRTRTHHRKYCTTVVTSDFPDYALILMAGIREYLPRAGELLSTRIRAKIGVYQPGWPPLAESTMRRKVNRIRGIGKRTKGVFDRFGGALAGGTGDAPLIDRGAMKGGLRSRMKNKDTMEVSMPFPMEVHEQDPFMGIPAEGIPPTPKRAAMWPAWEEVEGQVVTELENRLAGML
jgi:hypothetical protein